MGLSAEGLGVVERNCFCSAGPCEVNFHVMAPNFIHKFSE